MGSLDTTPAARPRALSFCGTGCPPRPLSRAGGRAILPACLPNSSRCSPSSSRSRSCTQSGRCGRKPRAPRVVDGSAGLRRCSPAGPPRKTHPPHRRRNRRWRGCARNRRSELTLPHTHRCPRMPHGAGRRTRRAGAARGDPRRWRHPASGPEGPAGSRCARLGVRTPHRRGESSRVGVATFYPGYKTSHSANIARYDSVS